MRHPPIWLLLLLFALAPVRAADLYWVAAGPGTWNDGANWSATSAGTGGAGVPTGGDRVFFDGGGSGGCTLDAAPAIAGLTMAPGYAGVLDLGAFSLSISGDADLRSGGAITGTTGSVTMAASGTVTPPVTTIPNLVIAAGTTTLSGGTLTVAGGLTIASGAVLASGDQDIRVAGNWSNSGTFTAGAATVILNGVGGSTQTIDGQTTFNHLTATCTTARTLQFANGTTQVIAGTLTLTGASGQVLRLRSTASPATWSLTPNGTRSCSYVDVQDGINTTATPINPTYSVNGGNDAQWFGNDRYWVGRSTAGGDGTTVLDGMTAQPRIAFSLRRLRTAYTGPAVRVRRTTDNAEADVAFDATGWVGDTSTVTVTAIGSSALSLSQTLAFGTFSAASDVMVTTWYDQSGNSGKDAVQATTANQPLLASAGVINRTNGRPAVYSGATSKRLTSVAGDLNGLTAAAINSVAFPTALNDTGGYGDASGVLQISETGSWGITVQGVGQAKASSRFGTGQSGNVNTLTRAATITSTTITTTVYDGSSERIFVDGSELLTATGKLSPTAFLDVNVNLFNAYIGHISEIMLFATTLGSGDRGILEASQRAVYMDQLPWSSSANWAFSSGGVSGAPVPTAADTIRFDANCVRSCTLDGSATVAAVVMDSGYTGTLNFGTYQLTVNGDADLRSGGGSVAFGGTGGLVMGASATLRPPSGAAIPNLTISAGTTTLAGNDLSVSSALFIASGATLDSGARNISCGGAWTGNGTFVRGTGTVTCTGASGATQTITGTGRFAHLTISGGTTSLAQSVIVDGNLAIDPSATLLANNQDITVGGNITASGAFTAGSGTVVCDGHAGAQTITTVSASLGNLTISGGSTALGSNLAVNGNLSIASGATLVAGGQTLSVAGNWSNSGTFTPGTSTVILNGAGGSTQAVSGDSSFNNLTATCTTARTLQFAAGSTQTIAGTMTLTGGAGQLLRLRSSASAAWIVNPSACTCSYVDVQYGTNSSAQAVNPTYSVDGGNTTNWFGPDRYWVGTMATLDDIGVASAASYSLRKLRAAYAGSAILVRRSSDNTTQAIGFAADGTLNIAALTAFVGAGSGFVQTWYDQSGNGRNATQAVAGSQPRIVNAGTVETVGGVPAVYFLGSTSGRLATANFSAYNGGWTSIATAKVNANVSRNTVVTKTFSTSSYPFEQYNNRFAGSLAMTTGLYAATGLATWSFVTNPSNSTAKAYVNGVANGSGSTSLIEGGRPLMLGGSGSNASALNGWIIEVLTFGSPLSDSNRQKLEAYQMAYAKLTNGLVWSSAANWAYTSGGPAGAPAPTATTAVTFNGSSVKSCTVDGAVSAAALTLGSTYTGTLALGDNALTVYGNADLRTGGSISATAGGLVMAATGTLIPPVSATVPHLTISGGTTTVSTNHLSVAGNLSIAAGATLVGGDRTLTVGGAWSNAGTFTPGSSTVILGGTSQVISGSTTFNNLTVTAPKTVTIAAGTTQSFSGQVTLVGTAVNRITIASSVPGTPAFLSKPSGTVLAEYLTLSDSAARGGAVWHAGTNSSDGGGNSGWIFPFAGFFLGGD